MTMNHYTDIAALIGSVLNHKDVWNANSQFEISALNFPEQLLGRRKDLLRGDIHREWGRWFIEQFMDEKYYKKEINYPMVWIDVKEILDNILGWEYEDEKKKYIARVITQYVIEQVELSKKSRKRNVISLDDKNFLLSLHNKQPRCWLTGVPFSENAIDTFLGYRYKSIDLPSFIDRYLPIGVIEQHLLIEVDHLYPLHSGGDNELDNYKLICGWANRVKSSQISLYMKGTGAIATQNLGIDNYYWALRAIGMRRRCEHPGCNATLDNASLTIESYHGQGKLINPISMKVLCYDHIQDKERFIKRDSFLA